MKMHELQGDTQDALPVRLLTTQEVQRILKVDRSTVYRMAEDGRLPAIKVGRQWRFPEDRLADHLQSRRHDAPPPQAAGGASSLRPGTLQAAADFLADALGTMVVLTDLQGRPLAEPGNPCGLFGALHDYPGVLERCVAGWEALAAEADLGPQWRVTPLGFLCARSLVREGDRLVAMVLAGGVAPAAWPPGPEQATRLAADLGVPPVAIAEHAAEVYHLEAAEMQRVLNLLPRAAAFLSRLLSAAGRPGSPETTAAPAADSSQRSET